MANQHEDVFGANWERFFSDLSSFLGSAENSEHPNKDYSEYVVHRSQMWIVSISHLLTHLQSIGEDNVSVVAVIGYLTELTGHLRFLLSRWTDYLDHYDVHNPHSYVAVVTRNENPGRPRFDISKEQLEYLRSMSFSWVEISQMLGVSYTTVYRRRIQYGIIDDRGTDLSDANLIRIVHEMKHEQPALGQTMVWARVKSLGYKVTRARVRDAIRTSDPISSAFRWTEMTRRRPYSVPSPNSLWHLDGQHKLIRWRMVVHAAIDGFSRTVLFIKCSDNNRARTVYSHFLKAVGQYGLPSRIRVDQGGENIVVAQHMLRHRGVDRRSVLVGSSVHNQRIERLWRDSHRCATAFFYRLFYFLERNEVLDPLDEEHLFALHYVYLPRVNKSLSVFHSAWNDHNIRTEGGRTPKQLFTAGVLRMRHSGLVAIDFFERISRDYGTEEEGGAGVEDNTGVPIPRISVMPSEEQVMELRQMVDPLNSCDNFGIPLYLQALEIVQSWSRTV